MTRITINEAALDCNADQIGSTARAELGFDLAAIVRRGLIADADRVSDLEQGTTFSQERRISRSRDDKSLSGCDGVRMLEKTSSSAISCST